MSKDLKELLDRLRTTYTAEIHPDCPSPARARHVLMLRILTMFLESAGLERSYCEEIMKLENGLRDLDKGKVSPLLEASATSSRPPDPTDVWLGRALVALVFEALTWSAPTPSARRRKGLTREAAMRFIAMRQRHIRHLMTKKAKNAGTAAANWHWQLKEGQAGSAIASVVFSEGVKEIDAAMKAGADVASVERWADEVLKSGVLIALSVGKA